MVPYGYFPKVGLRIVKYDRLSHSPMNGVTFEIFHNGTSIGRYETQGNGEIVLTGIEPGTYRAVEVDTGDGEHILDTSYQEVELVAGGGTKELLFYNDKKPGMFIDWRQLPAASDALQWAGWIWRGTAVWDKGNSRPQKGRFRQQAEYIVWGSNGDMPISRPVPCLPGVFKYGNPQNRIHLTEKPLQLMRDIVKITEPGGHILDPFAGSGTTILAAVLEGYTATGIEVTDEYARRARERIAQELNQAA